MGFFQGILAGVIQWCLKELADWGLKSLKLYFKYGDIDIGADSEAKEVNKAIRAAKEAVDKCESCDKKKPWVKKEDEKRLRQTTRKLTDGFYS